MLFLTILTFAVLFAIFYRMHRNLLCPPLVFTGTWLISLIGVLLSGDTLYDISVLTYLIYLIGAISFCVGGALGLDRLSQQTVSCQTVPVRRQSYWPYRALIICLLIVLIGLPFYWQEVSSMADNVSADKLLYNIRHKTIQTTDEAGSFGILANFVVIAQFVAMAMFYEMDGSRNRRWLALCAIILALVYGGMTGAKGNAVKLVLTLFFVSSIKNRKVHIGSLLAALAIAISFFSLGLVMINFAFETSSGPGAVIIRLVETIQNYWLGGLVGFDQVVLNPTIMESTQPIYRFFFETARSLGMDVYVPPTHAAYLWISPTMDTNAYTIYFSYFKDLGWIGTTIIMFGLGLALTMLYRKVMRGGVIGIIFYANFCAAIILSFHAEHFFTGMNGYIKMLIFLTFTYKFLPMMERRSSVEIKYNA
jgi:oligosaccharide repeat unit polymerase